MTVHKDALFEDLRTSLLSIDPVAWAEKYLILDNEPFTLHGNGYKPFADLYRYIGIKSLEQGSKPTIVVKGRQVGASTTAAALELYFMASGFFGTNGKPPIRIIHAFPQRELAEKFSKEKLNTMIASAIPIPTSDKKQSPKSFIQAMLDQSSDTGDSLKFKLFRGGNFIRIDSTGIDGNRLRGGTADVIFYDECFPYSQNIETIDGKMPIGAIYRAFAASKHLPLVKTFNESTNAFEYKRITNAWERGEKSLVQITCGNKEIRCTPNHRFLTDNGWIRADQIKPGELLKTSIGTNLHIRALNEDQMQAMLGSFLGDGHVEAYKLNRYRVGVIHGIKQQSYCEWKASIFGSDIVHVEKNGYSQKPAVKFTSKVFGLNQQMPRVKTTCPQWVLDAIDARGIAIWWMDDGTVASKWGSGDSMGAAGCLSTCSFDEDSQIRIVAKFKSIGIDCHYAKYGMGSSKKSYYSIYFNKDGFRSLCDMIEPYMHESMLYKAPWSSKADIHYQWNNQYKPYGFTVVDKVIDLNRKEMVYDIEVEDNHNFVLAPSRATKNLGGPIVHNCQDISSEAMGNTVEMLKQANWGNSPGGVQFYFGTPKRNGSDFYRMWERSSQQYYYLGCEECKELFPLYTPQNEDDMSEADTNKADGDEWKKIWIHGFIVKCPHCGCEQDKREAAERGKWKATHDINDKSVLYNGFHLSQLYMPVMKREDIDAEMPQNHPTNTERKYRNEVLGEFYQGDATPLTSAEIIATCGERERGIRARIMPGQEQLVVLGIDYGARSDLEVLANPEARSKVGQSYTTACLLSVKGPNLFSVDLALKFPHNDPERKKGIIENIMRQYSVNLAIGDIGYSNDFSHTLHTIYGDKYLVSRAANKVNEKVKYNPDVYPKEIVFERDWHITEMYELLKKGQIKFPLKDYDRIGWAIDHCCNMEMKPSISRNGGDPEVHYVKNGPNDFAMALINAMLAYRFYITKGFRVKNPNLMAQPTAKRKGPLAILGAINRSF
jgi:hypothetical protein